MIWFHEDRESKDVEEKGGSMDKRFTDSLLKVAFIEDFSALGDVTGSAVFSDQTDGFVLVSKAAGILCGIEEFCEVFHSVDHSISTRTRFQDGHRIRKGMIIAEISGRVSSVLKAERTALNILSHLSGIATKTARFVNAAGGKAIILDTRKTLPGLRQLQKYAVRCGGGQNHRSGLYDMVMVKDNHIDAAGGITHAVNKVRKMWNDRFKIEVETRNLEEVAEALKCDVDRIMLDNMEVEMIRKAVRLIGGKSEVEASGNMTLRRIPQVAETGVDYISVGELTHSVKAFDFSLKKNFSRKDGQVL